jgi:uncharacterized protein (TIGR02453 family)
MAFAGWTTEATEFFEGLEADNSKSYWQAHRAIYDDRVRRPMEELLAELAPEFGEGKVFRPYRDVRFSLDKSPYKTTIAATLGDGYVQFSADGLGAARGSYVMAPDQLAAFRRAIDDERTGAQLVRIVADLRATGAEVTAHETLKTVPRGYARDHPRADLLRLKGLVGWQEWPTGPWLATAESKRRIVTFLRACEPLTGWLVRHVGPSAQPEGHRR